jgi:hypothetical protein
MADILLRSNRAAMSEPYKWKSRRPSHQHTERAEMADPRSPASDGNVRFQVYVKVTPAEGEEFKVRLDFGRDPE